MNNKKGTGRNGLTRYICASLFLLVPFSTLNSAQAQVAGLDALTVLDLGSTARTSGLGLDWLAVYGDDLSVGIDNPSLLRPTMAGTGMLTVAPLFDGGSLGSISYAHATRHAGTFCFGFHFAGYGSFDEYDEEENRLGQLSAGDYALRLGWGMWLDSNFAVGANFKPVLSQYGTYTALAMAFDLAASYVSDSRALAASLMARNIGAQLLTFDGTAESLPFELSAEVSYRLRNAPFRLFAAATELQRWNLRYDDPLHPTRTVDPFTGEVNEEGWMAGTLDNLMRHTQLGVELSLGRVLSARLGYSWRQTAEMRGVDAFNLSGFSFGIGIHTRRLDFAYARRNYHLGQAPNYFTLSYKF